LSIAMTKRENNVHSRNVPLKPLCCAVYREIDKMLIQKISCAEILRLYSGEIEISNFHSNVGLTLSGTGSLKKSCNDVRNSTFSC